MTRMVTDWKGAWIEQASEPFGLLHVSYPGLSPV